MGSHPLNLALRFALELVAWFAPGYWGWTQHDGPARILLGIGLPVLVMAVWGIFRVPNDPGPAPVAIPGPLRLGIEVAVFVAAVVAFAAAGSRTAALALSAVTLAHYAVSVDRIRWLMAQRRP